MTTPPIHNPVTGVNGGRVLDVTMALDTNALADGDVMGTTVEIPNAVREPGGSVLLHSLVVHDESDQGQPFDAIFMDANVSLGTANSAPNLTDANGRSIIERVSIASGDYYDFGAFRKAFLHQVGVEMQAAAGQTSLWLSGISRGTGTYAASGIRLKLGVLYL